MWLRLIFCCLLSLFCVIGAAQSPRPNDPLAWRLQLMRAEDTRQWNADAAQLLTHTDPRLRAQAALSAGRIGDERAVAPLVELLQHDKDANVRAMAAFALGEIDSVTGTDALINQASYQNHEPAEVRARAVEALGKIAAALPETGKERKAVLGAAILDALRFEAGRRSAPDSEVILSGLTAVLRAKAEGAGAVVSRFLRYSDPRIRADALNTMARLKAKDEPETVRELVAKDPDAVVRANAARVIGAAEDKEGRDYLLDRAVNDQDQRVRVAAIRSLSSVGDAHAAEVLLTQGSKSLAAFQAGKAKQTELPPEQNELLEIATTLGKIYAGKASAPAIKWLKEVR